ncbi:MAG: glycosyltransferase family 4 protein [Victivallales bacterium]|nr:glycosyltransferase family 4 protein [Victivallales bacterium]
MHFVFLSDNMNFSGGRRLLMEYALYLRGCGHRVDFLVQDDSGKLSGMLEVTLVRDFKPSNIPECDRIVATTPREVMDAWFSSRGEVVHFCQGFEITDLEQRVNGEVLPPRLKGKGLMHKFRIARKKYGWKKKIAKIDAVYRLPSVLVVVSKHIQRRVQERYGREALLCENGIHNEYFYPPQEFKPPAEGGPTRVVSVGPLKVSFKGVETTFKAVKLAKERGLRLEFIRVAPEITDFERSAGFIDRCYENIRPGQLGEILRSSQIFVSNSTEGEGFGLPALEAMSCGMIPVLSSIQSYRDFSDTDDFAYFVPEHDATATAAAIETICKTPDEELLQIRRRALDAASRFSFKKACAKFEDILCSQSPRAKIE